MGPGYGMGGKGAPGPGWQMERKGPVSPELEKKVLEEIGKVSPYLKEKLIKAKQEHPRFYNMVIRRAIKGYFWWQKLKKDPEGKKFADKLWKLSIKEKELAVRYRNATSEKEKKRIISELKKIDSTLFDLRQKARELTIRDLEEKIKKIKEELKERKAHKEEIIQEHIDRLTGREKRWSW